MNMQQTMKARRSVMTMAAVLTVALTATQGGAAITDMLSSLDFGTYRYEMDSKPNDEDLDANGTNDFVESKSGTAVAGFGILTLTSTLVQSAYFINNSDGGAWRTLAPTRASGYTIELRLKVVSQADDSNGVVIVTSTASDSNADSALRIGADFVKWGNSPLTTLQSGTSNSDGFHIFRLAMEEGQAAGSEKFTVWRDGVLLADNLTDTFANNGLNRIYFGDPSTANTGGKAEIGYVRFTSGAYAPTPIAAYDEMDSSVFPKKFEMTVADGDFDPATTPTAEWTRTASGTYTALLSGGSLNLDTSATTNTTAYWQSRTWAALSATGMGFTVEARLKVDTALGLPAGYGFRINAGNGHKAGFLVIGPGGTYWREQSISLDSNSNSDKMHVFRLAYDGEDGMQVWRDGVQIGKDLSFQNNVDSLYFGDATPLYSGIGAFDYVRWTMGIYAPLPPPPRGTLIKVY